MSSIVLFNKNICQNLIKISSKQIVLQDKEVAKHISFYIVSFVGLILQGNQFGSLGALHNVPNFIFLDLFLSKKYPLSPHLLVLSLILVILCCYVDKSSVNSMFGYFSAKCNMFLTYLMDKTSSASQILEANQFVLPRASRRVPDCILTFWTPLAPPLPLSVSKTTK